MGPANDGTNACAFLCAKLAHDLYMSEERKCGFVQLTLTKLPSLVEKTINELPIEINKVRTRDLCHVDEAYRILRQIGSVTCDYEFREKILHGEHIFSPESRACLRKAVSDIASKEQFCTALFCCEPYVFLVGVLGGKLFLIDTHPVNQDLGGNGHGGLVKPYHNCSPKACKALCGWLWQRLRTGGGLTEKAGHSFLLMSPETSTVSSEDVSPTAALKRVNTAVLNNNAKGRQRDSINHGWQARNTILQSVSLEGNDHIQYTKEFSLHREKRQAQSTYQAETHRSPPPSSPKLNEAKRVC
ncbi:uncharacterized protein LOC122954481 isoform X2 [Acropora millepora]|uniref:uncharacterized protein LOC122954481 isoform X2 n=1 Tax=Acropora millepora TaxID=45264 RepID=UPI001CF24678|nr:uncharacterized protein LOC122954481 isoform X2 [Acropora millepora]